MNELWKNPELIPNYQPQSQQKMVTSLNNNEVFMKDYRLPEMMDAMNKLPLQTIPKPMNSPNFMFSKFTPMSKSILHINI